MYDGATPARGYNLCVDVGFKQPVIKRTVEFSTVSVCLVCTLIYTIPDMHIQPSRNIALMLNILIISGSRPELTNLLSRVFSVHIFRFVATQCSLIISDLSMITHRYFWWYGCVFYFNFFPCNFQFSSRLSVSQMKRPYLNFSMS